MNQNLLRQRNSTWYIIYVGLFLALVYMDFWLHDVKVDFSKEQPNLLKNL